MAGRKKKQVSKRSKKKTVKRSKNTKKVDLNQRKLPFLPQPSTSSENLQDHIGSHSADSSFTADLQCQLSGTTLSSDSSGMKRRCQELGGPQAKRPLVDNEISHESLEDIDEEEHSESFEEIDDVERTYSSGEFDESELFSDSLSDEGSGELENKKFSEYQQLLNSAVTVRSDSKPPQLDEKLCKGVGDPSEVWSLMCRKDDLDRINVNDVNGSVEKHVRAVLVDWMMEVCENEKQHRETFHLSVNYLDRFLAVDSSLAVTELQCLGTVALFLASKYEEIYPPKLESFVEYTDGACTVEQVEMMERIVLHRLEWSLSKMTSVHWLNTFCQLMGSKRIKEEDAHYNEKPILLPEFLRDHFMNMAKILDIAVMDMDHLQFSYRQLAAAVLFVDYEPHTLVESVTGYTYKEMLPVIEWISPCYVACDTRSLAGDPFPHVTDVSSEEWHDIQTHGRLNVDRGFKDVRSQREENEKKRTETRKNIEGRRRTRKTLRQANATMSPMTV